MDVKGKRVLVTGGCSFIGQYVCKLLINRGATVDPCPHIHANLLNPAGFEKYFREFQPDCMIAMAGYNGNIQFNKENGYQIYWLNTQMAQVTFACAHIAHANNPEFKLVSVLPSCAYADRGPNAILTEDRFTDGEPHPTVAYHGLAKRVYHYHSKFTRETVSLNAVCVVLNNVMGPGDSTDLNKTKVSMSLIKKFVDAQRVNASEVTLWGTGISKRELLYVEDAAEGIVRVLEGYDDSSEPINIGTGFDISIKDFAELVKQLVGYTGEIKWDTSKGDGQLKKLLDNEKMKRVLNWEPKVSLREGLEKTIQWYKENN